MRAAIRVKRNEEKAEGGPAGRLEEEREQVSNFEELRRPE